MTQSSDLFARKGQVVFVSSSSATVRLVSNSSCKLCPKGGCGAFFSRAAPPCDQRLTLPNHLNAGEGDWVLVCVSGKGLFICGLLLYMLPLAMMFGTTFIASLFYSESPMFVLVAVAGFALGLMLATRLVRTLKSSLSFSPMMRSLDA